MTRDLCVRASLAGQTQRARPWATGGGSHGRRLTTPTSSATESEMVVETILRFLVACMSPIE